MQERAHVKAAEAAASLPNSRRRHRRWEFRQELSFSYDHGGETHFGSGRTKDLSEHGVRFENDHAVPAGTDIELRIAWPIRLQDRCPLDLIIHGSLVRSDRRGAVIHIRTCEFHTCGACSFQSALDQHSCSALG